MSHPKDLPQRLSLLWTVAAMIAQLIMAISMAYITPYLNKEPYHTSILSGFAWLQELLNGHPERIKNELRMHKHVFVALVQELWESDLDDSKFVTLEEQTAIFLYTCVTGLKSHHVAERFQHSHTTITKYFFVFSMLVCLTEKH